MSLKEFLTRRVKPKFKALELNTALILQKCTTLNQSSGPRTMLAGHPFFQQNFAARMPLYALITLQTMTFGCLSHLLQQSHDPWMPLYTSMHWLALKAVILLFAACTQENWWNVWACPRCIWPSTSLKIVGSEKMVFLVSMVFVTSNVEFIRKLHLFIASSWNLKLYFSLLT